MPTPFRPLKGFGHLIINADEVFGTDKLQAGLTMLIFHATNETLKINMEIRRCCLPLLSKKIGQLIPN